MRRVLSSLVVAVLSLGVLVACEPKPAVVEITYEVQFKGATQANRQQFIDHVASTLADGRGWALNGSIRFRRVGSGGRMVLWLVEPSRMADFGPPCMHLWSCRSGRNVAINDLRWRTGAPGWKPSVDLYQHYVVNHEVGHFMGQGHVSCSGSGHFAPVMMQQSKSVAPCVNVTWPLTWEKQQVARRWGVPL